MEQIVILIKENQNQTKRKLSRMNVFQQLSRLNILMLSFMATMIVLGLNIFISSLPFSESLSNVEDINFLKEELGATGFFFLVVILAPLFETLIFQALIISATSWVLRELKVYYHIIPALLSSLAFALVHSYHLTYVILGFFVGFVFASLYIVVEMKKSLPILVVTIAHSMVNLVPFLKDFVFT